MWYHLTSIIYPNTVVDQVHLPMTKELPDSTLQQTAHKWPDHRDKELKVTTLFLNGADQIEHQWNVPKQYAGPTQ